MHKPDLPFVLLCVLLVLGGCRGALELTPSDASVVLSRQLLDAPDPGAPGPHAVLTLTYGSGTDRHRPEYGDSVTVRTETVDGSRLVSFETDARDGDDRREFWGFGPERLPVNARVWYPAGDGPFPLVLIVHGNHDDREFSDPGYDYLGEHLASRGFILASVDMNFINGAIDRENDARGWLLLKHLEAWRGFTSDPGNPFHGRADLDRVALIGHSRGGEAVGHAAAFNRLSRYPDDALLTFDFGFGIRSVVAIAPVDGQYLPADQRVPLENVNYLVFHGSHDSDVTSFHGLRQYNRVRFTDSGDWFKSAVYVYRANHGQWNTIWGSTDSGGDRGGRILDLRGLLDAEAQREFARVYIGAFLETTLHDDDRYLPLFRDHRVAGDWLPPTMYVTRFRSSGFHSLAGFEEDIDVTSGTAGGVTLRGDGLRTWREEELQLRSSNRPTTPASQINQAVVVGWNHRYADGERMDRPPRYIVDLPEGLAGSWGVDGGWTLEMHAAPTRDRPSPWPSDDIASPGSGEDEPGAAASGPPELSVEVVDGAGRTARVPLERYGPVRYPLEMKILRRQDIEDRRFPHRWELILQHYSIPLADFEAATPSFDAGMLDEIRLVFDRDEAGTFVVDEIGLARLRPGFLAASGASPER